MPTRARSIVAVLFAVALTVASCSSATDGQQGTAQSPSATTSSTSPEVPVAVTPVLTKVVAAPVPVPATDGKTHLAYELELTNTLNQEVTLTSVAVHAGDKTLLTPAATSSATGPGCTGRPRRRRSWDRPRAARSGSTSHWTRPPLSPLISYTRSASRSPSRHRR